ncbi:MAG: hypothetical protein AAFU53_04870, partial [Cyanobacteria bacterium J06632_3]
MTSNFGVFGASTAATSHISLGSSADAQAADEQAADQPFTEGNSLTTTHPTLLPADLDPARMPAHVAVIMDGNGR